MIYVALPVGAAAGGKACVTAEAQMDTFVYCACGSIQKKNSTFLLRM